jgi:muramoyltetrapeptide carboxypeptidase
MRSSRLTQPRALQLGGKIGIFSPAGPPAPERVKYGIAALEAKGFRCQVADDAIGAYEYFSAPDAVRLQSFNKMLADPTIDMMMMTRGGYGLSRIVHRIDWEAVRRAGKILCGFSDFTAINLAAVARGNFITFAGPGAATDFGEAAYEGTAAVEHNFMEAHFWPVIHGEEISVDVESPHTYAAQQITGPIWGSNLSLLSHLVGTPFLPKIEGGILFLEEIGERPYAVERMILQLYHCGLLAKQQAILIGEFTDCKPEETRFPYSMEHVVNTLRRIVDCPVLEHFPFGHVARKLTIPFGADATLSIHESRYRVQY